MFGGNVHFAQGFLACTITAMVTSLIASILTALPPTAPVFAGNLAGNFSIVQGTLVSNGQLGNSPQSITVHFGGSDHTYNNIYLLGDPNGSNYFGGGNVVTIVLPGSAPLKGTYNALSMQVQMAKFPTVGATRTVPCSATGALNYGVAIPLYTTMRFLTPGFSIDNFDFPNGAVITVNAYPASFSIPLPSTGANSSGTEWPPLGSNPPFTFSFAASGPKTNMYIGARGNTRPLTVQGSLTGSSTSFDQADFTITHSVVEN